MQKACFSKRKNVTIPILACLYDSDVTGGALGVGITATRAKLRRTRAGIWSRGDRILNSSYSFLFLLLFGFGVVCLFFVLVGME